MVGLMLLHVYRLELFYATQLDDTAWCQIE